MIELFTPWWWMTIGKDPDLEPGGMTYLKRLSTFRVGRDVTVQPIEVKFYPGRFSSPLVCHAEGDNL